MELDTRDGHGRTLLPRVRCAHRPSPQAPWARAPLGLQVPNSSWPERGGGWESLPLGSLCLCLNPGDPHSWHPPPPSHIATSLDCLSQATCSPTHFFRPALCGAMDDRNPERYERSPIRMPSSEILSPNICSMGSPSLGVCVGGGGRPWRDAWNCSLHTHPCDSPWERGLCLCLRTCQESTGGGLKKWVPRPGRMSSVTHRPQTCLTSTKGFRPLRREVNTGAWPPGSDGLEAPE